MKPADYDAWYDTSRGRWIGGTEYALLKSLLRPGPDASLLDIGCGTGYFTRLFAGDMRGRVVGVDPDEEALDFARAHAVRAEEYVHGRAESLPFADQSFDFAASVAALCFVQDQKQALREMIRVTRRRFVLGLLNRRSLLYAQKGRHGGSGAYRGAHWHTVAEIRGLLASLPVANAVIRTAIMLPKGDWLARLVESIWPGVWICGGFVAVAGDVCQYDSSACV